MKKEESTEEQNQATSVKVKVMSTVGNIEQFDVTQPEKWVSYYTRYELFLIANDVQGEERKKATFLTLAGPQLFDLLTSLASPKPVSALSLINIKEILTNHFSPRPSEIGSFYKFHKRDQHPDESFADYLAALRKIAVDCNFGSSLDRMLRDRLVCGIRDESLQKSLLAENDLSLQKVIDRALAAESAIKNVLEIRHPEQIQFISQQKAENSYHIKNNSQKQNCNGCGGNHQRAHCPHRDTICFICKRRGHLQRVCRSLIPRSSSNSRTHQKDDGSMNKCHSINQILPDINMKKSVNIILNGHTCVFEIDTGSNFTIMSSDVFHTIWPNKTPEIYKGNVKLMDFQKNKIPVVGLVDVYINYDNKQIEDLPLIIVEGNQSNILGWNWFHALGIRIEGVNSIKNVSINNLLHKYQNLFNDDLGCYNGTPIHLPVEPTVTPIRFPPRRIPLAT